MSTRPAEHLKLALGTMFLQQTFISLGKSLPAVIAPAIILDLHLAPAWIGIYFGLTAVAALFVQLGCGSFIVRYGALRMSQLALLLLAAGTAFLTTGNPLLLVISAIVGGGGAAVSTPASSHLLSRCSPPQYLPLVFSLKQTAVPAGLLLAGVLAPQMTEWLGWRTTMLFCAAACAVFAVMLQPVRGIFDTDRVPTRMFKLSDFRTTLAAVLATPRLRALSFACLAFNGLQTAVTAYFVVYLTTIGYTPVGLARQRPCFAAPHHGGTFARHGRQRRAPRHVQCRLARARGRPRRLPDQRHRAVVARHPARRNRARLPGGHARRRHGRRALIRPGRRAGAASHVFGPA
ncbi:MAG: MFS transporter [Betaproteobacteria bacterium]|nr:MFS transporter [Betaproteobacteria bacterium]